MTGIESEDDARLLSAFFRHVDECTELSIGVVRSSVDRSSMM